MDWCKNFIKSWPEIRLDFIKVNPELGKIIDELSPDQRYYFYCVEYPYGAQSLQNGKLYLPKNNNYLVPITSHDIDNKTKENLSYNYYSNPASLILENTAEIFIDLGNRIVTLYGLIPPGSIFSTWPNLTQADHNTPVLSWNMTAGARSILMMQKISDKQAHSNLKKIFDLKHDAPRTMMDHWHVFKDIANHPSFGEPWKTKILFFIKNWFQHIDDPAWQNFYYYLYKKAWNNSDFWRNQFQWDLIFSIIHKNKNLKHSAHFVSTVQQLFSMAAGAVSGFAPAIDNHAGPIDRIIQAYKSVYNIFGYPPVIVTPNTFILKDHPRPTYYSLNFPTSMEFSFKPRQRTSLISELLETKELLQLYIEELLSNQLNVNNTLIYKVLQQVEFNFFHSDINPCKEIQQSQYIPKTDSSLYDNHGSCFPINSPFFRSCVQINKKI